MANGVVLVAKVNNALLGLPKEGSVLSGESFLLHLASPARATDYQTLGIFAHSLLLPGLGVYHESSGSFYRTVPAVESLWPVVADIRKLTGFRATALPEPFEDMADYFSRLPNWLEQLHETDMRVQRTLNFQHQWHERSERLLNLVQGAEGVRAPIQAKDLNRYFPMKPDVRASLYNGVRRLDEQKTAHAIQRAESRYS